MLVDDELYDADQHLKPNEAERLHGLPVNCTAAPGATNLDRLKAIGHGWDVIVTSMLLAHSSLEVHTHATHDEPQHMQQLIIHAMDHLGPQAVADVLTELPDAVAQGCLGHLVSHYVFNIDGDYSVLDSGSARHLNNTAFMLDPENRSALTGFDGSVSWTNGSGYLPVDLHDEWTGESLSVDITDVDIMSSDLVSNILSLGKLLRSGFEFHLTNGGKECYAVSPGGAARIKIILGSDDILRIQHQARTGAKAIRLPTAPVKHTTQSAGLTPVMALARSAGMYDAATSCFFHDILNHCGDEKAYRTLGVTKGYKQTRLKPYYCKTCAASKARNFGLSRKHPPPAPVMPAYEDAQYNDTFDDMSSSDDESGDELDMDTFTAETAGRELGIQPVQRYDLSQLKLWEIMYVDNKDYPCSVRGGAKQVLLFVDHKSRMKAVAEVKAKSDNGTAYNGMVSSFGIHKVNYSCRVYSDGCGSMVHVKQCATKMGIDHAYVPPHQQSLNEAEKVVDQIFGSARALMARSQAPDKYFGFAVKYSVYVDARTATTSSRAYKTPYELSRGIVPDISRLHRFWTACFVQVPKSKRRALAKKGLHNLRAEPGRFVGFQDMFSNTYAVILDIPPHPLVHSINVTFDDSDFTTRPGPDAPDMDPTQLNFPTGAQSEEANIPHNGSHNGSHQHSPESHHSHSPQHAQAEEAHNPLCDWPQPYVQLPTLILPPSLQQPELEAEDWWQPTEGSRPRPDAGHFSNMQHVFSISHAGTSVINNILMLHPCDPEMASSLHEIDLHARGTTFMELCFVLATNATKDMNWDDALSGPNADKAIAALQLELDSLESTILTRIDPNSEEFAVAKRLATPGRILLDIKRNGLYKARGVKQGFRENKAAADGPDFNYYAHVAKLVTVRSVLCRYKRGTRRVAIKDVKTAFLQSDPYPDGTVKYICFKHPITKEIIYYRQAAPIYGEASAPIRWENTIAPFFETINMSRGENEKCCFHEPDKDLLAVLYVDDALGDGEEDDISWLFAKLDDRFECKGAEWLEPDSSVDYLGMTVSQDDTYLYMSMSEYILKCLKELGWEDLKPASTPIDCPIDPDAPAVSPEIKHMAMKAIGMLGWLSITVRCDVTYAHSRISQYQSKINESVVQALHRCFRYLAGTHDYGIRSPLHDDYNHQAVSPDVDPVNNQGWEFFVDSDFAGNEEETNKRRSQNGYICLCNGAPILWSSKASSVAFADEDIGEAHADISSGAVEVCAAANASMDFMNLKHIISELNMPFPKPYKLQIDNAAALVFAKNTASKTRLKHIDQRQQWVKVLRDKNISEPVHVPTEFNLADLFTKILPPHRFKLLRDRCLYRVPIAALSA